MHTDNAHIYHQHLLKLCKILYNWLLPTQTSLISLNETKQPSLQSGNGNDDRCWDLSIAHTCGAQLLVLIVPVATVLGTITQVLDADASLLARTAEWFKGGTTEILLKTLLSGLEHHELLMLAERNIRVLVIKEVNCFETASLIQTCMLV